MRPLSETIYEIICKDYEESGAELADQMFAGYYDDWVSVLYTNGCFLL